MTHEERRLIGESDARSLARHALSEGGLSPEDAAEVADALVDTSLRGIDTHGLRLLPQYLDELADGVARARPEIRIVRDRGAGVLLDADGALGVVAGLTAARLAAERSAEYGVCAAAVRNSNHFGAASVYTRHLARRGLVGLAVTSAASRVAPFGGVEPLFGTNPISVAAAADGDEFVLDMATAQVCFGEVQQRRAEARPLERGWATDSRGRATQDPAEAHALSPLGGYKGQGLASAVTLLAAVLTGSPQDWRLTQVGQGETGRGREVGHLLIALDPDAFCGREEFTAGLSGLLTTVRAAPAASAASPVVAAGDPQRDHARERSRTGLPLDRRTAKVLSELARRLEGAVPFPEGGTVPAAEEVSA
ncbi:MAG TPA: Ldh family oxidoreductase [Streptomyces sp.]|nr:Ldh family oxidoreductase [Streptomyces sp.]